MSNRVNLVRTEFKEYPKGEISYGYRMYDDYGSVYCNMMEKADLDLPDKEFFKKCSGYFQESEDAMWEFALERGISINDQFYDQDDLKSFNQKVLDEA